MRSTTKNNSFCDRVTLTSDELALFMGCGRKAAVSAGMEAGARVQIGRRVLWNVKKLQKYLDSISQ